MIAAPSSGPFESDRFDDEAQKPERMLADLSKEESPDVSTPVIVPLALSMARVQGDLRNIDQVERDLERQRLSTRQQTFAVVTSLVGDVDLEAHRGNIEWPRLAREFAGRVDWNDDVEAAAPDFELDSKSIESKPFGRRKDRVLHHEPRGYGIARFSVNSRKTSWSSYEIA